ncbi:MAG: hypothetical protein IJ549_06880 [Prevotella sp.]|nr:hypothetical protein [Prevotella sp.]
MEKRLLAVLFVIGMIVYAIIQALPFILGGAALVGLVYLLIRLYAKYPDTYSAVGGYIITPLLIVGWLYVGYLAYTNLYHNTYVVEPGGYNSESSIYFKFTAKDDREAVVKAWEYYIKTNKRKIDAEDYYPYYSNRVRVYNHTNDEIVPFGRYNDLCDSLHYSNGKVHLSLADVLCVY